MWEATEVTSNTKTLLFFVPLIGCVLACRSDPRLPPHPDQVVAGSGGSAGKGDGGRGGSAGGVAAGSGGAPGGTGPTCSEAPPLKATVPFELSDAPQAAETGEAGAGGAGGIGGDGGAGGAGGAGGEPSRCVRVTDLVGDRVTCSGFVERRTIEGRPAFVFDDGSTLTWTGAAEGEDWATGSSLAPPKAPAGVRLFIDYSEEARPFCPFCGGYTQRSVAIRFGEEDVLYVGQEGPDEVFASADLFGVSARSDAPCDASSGTYDCYFVVHHHYDMLLDTSPVQRIPYGAVKGVVTPNGSFDAVWRTAEVTATYLQNCYDGRTPLRTRDFAARRVVE